VVDAVRVREPERVTAPAVSFDDAAVPGSGPPAWRRIRRAFGGWAALRLATLVVVLVAWQLGATAAQTPWFPSLGQVVQRIADGFGRGTFQPAIVSSVSNLVVGFVIALVLGIAAGALMALSARARYALRFYVDALLFVPPVIFAPVFFAFFGLSNWTQVAVVVIFAIVVITLNTQAAVAGVDQQLIEMARTLGANRRQVLRDVVFASALPTVFSGVRLGLARAVKGMIVGELFITVSGLGGLERRFSSAFDAPGMWAIGLIVIALALSITSAVQVLDRAVNRWAE
jgi:NitT/TauT family transport system permease protein